ncbi:aldehyde dehydrogenase family protein [Subsaxibacter sp. CAU 1640]|uniref:aldehyde dehydrogenase family protein n=1 Tax=Subsaxibacter sp. CAU 1640 TaxID=2933271 RepID=UPI002003874F|nr:aldehyde dehydrogenase family protein [Subsaxibacter sp. CAU 1640]MCK7589763.1 aldehyde dehydrogenase family protein [Subsaxibacter sp. CAU 1640]
MTKYIDNRFYELFYRQTANQYKIGSSTYKERIEKLNALKHALEVSYKDDIRNAMHADFKKPFLETDLTEIYPVIKEIKFAKANLKSWMKLQKVDTPLALLGASSYIKYEPKGVCLIISPWNFPFNLTFGPLVSAIAAGNTVIIKPSEMTPNASKVMSKIIKEIFSQGEIALIEGDGEVSQELLKLPFNHIFFTGSPKIGKLVMKAASKHLASVTLELGGKSPVIIDESANLEKAVKKIIFGKFVNAGQTCIAPDYVLLKSGLEGQLVDIFKRNITELYSNDPQSSTSYCRIVNERHFKRLVSYLEEASQNQSCILSGGNYDSDQNFIEPSLVLNMPEDSKLMQEEIFGPILPVKTYQTIEEALSYINSKEKPLALYIYSKNKTNINSILENTRAGTGCINHNLVQFLNHNLPFGGSNNSGIGKSHGFFGFEAFSNRRSLMEQHTIGATDLLTPPYTNFKQKLVNMTLKWF